MSTENSHEPQHWILICSLSVQLYFPQKGSSALQIAFAFVVSRLHYCKIQTPNRRNYWNFTFTSLQN